MTVDNAKKQNILIVHNYYQIPGGEDTVEANVKTSESFSSNYNSV